jgi:ATP-binding cassette subfamily B multidrug efflux pump
MLKLTKYLKPFVGMIIAAVILLFVQAMCDLALPDYMSNIVNKGIQQGGIVNAVPGAIRQSQMDRLILFMSPDDKLEVAKNYTLIDKSSPDYNKYVKDYPSLAKEPVYILNNIDKSEIDKINPVMGRAFLAVSGIEKVKAEAKDGVSAADISSIVRSGLYSARFVTLD